MPSREAMGLSRYLSVGSLALLAVVGFDMFLHGGILAPLYATPTPFLLDSQTAFRRIPLGYASFAVLVFLLTWLAARLQIRGFSRGGLFGLKLGGLLWLAQVLGLASITTARPVLLVGWAIGQALELGIAGAVVGSGLAAVTLRPLALRVLLFFAVSVILGVVAQNLLA